MKQILIGKHHDITDFASKDAGRYILNSVHYCADKKLLEACDGKVLIRVPVVESEEFPPVKGASEAMPIDCIIPPGPFKKALANVPKSPSVDCLAYAKLDANGKVTMTTTDMDTEQGVTCTPLEGNYPNCDQIVPEAAPIFSICLAGGILKRIAEYALKHSSDDSCTVRFDFTENTCPVRFSINVDDLNGHTKATGVAMPIKLS